MHERHVSWSGKYLRQELPPDHSFVAGSTLVLDLLYSTMCTIRLLILLCTVVVSYKGLSDRYSARQRLLPLGLKCCISWTCGKKYLNIGAQLELGDWRLKVISELQQGHRSTWLQGWEIVNRSSQGHIWLVNLR